MKNLSIIPILLLFLFSGCQEERNKEEPLEQEESIEPQPFFEFDEISYYHFDIGMEYPAKDSILKTIVNDSQPESLNDSLFFKNLEELADTMILISPNKHEKYREIFAVYDNNEAPYETCVATWRDILVFKNKGTITGLVKFTFPCYRSYILGTKHTFRYGEDYPKIRELLFKELE